MSSQKKPPQKGKGQKPQQQIELQQKVQTLRKQNLEQSMTIKHLTSQLIQLKSIQTTQQAEYSQSTKQSAEHMQRLTLTLAAVEDRLKAIRARKEQLEIENECMKYKMQKVEKQYEEFKAMTKEEVENMRRVYDSEVKKYEATTAQYHQAIAERAQLIGTNQRLNQLVKEKQQFHEQQLADRDRQKLQTVDLLKKDMNQKSKQLKQQLLTIQRDQLDTNTRLTVLQNHQLLQELQFQAKQTQNILKQNQQLQKQLIQLKRQIQLQKQVNAELAKRSTIAKKLIQSINNNHKHASSLIQENNLLANRDPENYRFNNDGKSNKQAKPQKQLSIPQLKQTINILKEELTRCQSELKLKQYQLQHYQTLYAQNQPLYEAYSNTQNNLRTIMIRFLQDSLNGQRNIKENQNQDDDIEYDITRLRDTKVEEWTQSDIKITVKMLLGFMRPYLTTKGMKAQYLKLKSGIQQLDKNKQTVLDYPQTSHSYQRPSFLQKINPKHLKGKSLSTVLFTIKKPKSLSRLHQHSTNNSPQKQFSLHSILQDLKSKEQKPKKHQFQQYVFQVEKNKFISGQQLLVVNNKKKPPLQNIPQPEYSLESFRTKQSKKLIKTNYRQWGQKIQLHPKGSKPFKKSE